MALDLPVDTTNVQSAMTDGSSCSKSTTEPSQERPKPCCVCIEEKVARDECMLVNADGRTQCAELIQNYKACMRGYGFNV
ncbi:cytochrome C oxidase copper chaperone-domain-containing protein [Lipomyces kononenkoae]|uniref:Cytochrome C oxidase copper chaperone-domain-containing protein n=1 Tax=Lipomyces kononenkoae TaxID=34357 RepID=A0ACC3TCJ4_LIPKO